MIPVPSASRTLNSSAVAVGTNVAGQRISINCTVSRRVHGIENTPMATWTGQFEDDVEITGQNTSSAILTFRKLKTSHGKMYTCLGSLISPALSETYFVMENYSVIVNSKLCSPASM